MQGANAIKLLTVSGVKEVYRRTPIILPKQTKQKDFMKLLTVHRNLGTDGVPA